MKRILITGANSYIGTSFENYLKQWADKYHVDTVDMIGDDWRQKSFAGYDTVFHVAGIAHQKETRKNKELYYKVNRDLAIETAQKAKSDGVKQFIFLSSMSVYGLETGVITKDTVPKPKSHYGKSKLQAEEEISVLSEDKFIVATLRPPMVYGEGCKGNYQMLVKLALKLPIFPYVNNQRSMIHIDNLSEFVKSIIKKEQKGLYCPQDPKYVNTSELVRSIADEHGKKIRLIKGFSWAIWILTKVSSKVSKAFGDLIYELLLNPCENTEFMD